LAMGKAREAKQYAKTVEQDSKKTTRQLKVEMAAAEQKLAQSQIYRDAEVDRVIKIEQVSIG
jgi:predicted outer membrane protein